MGQLEGKVAIVTGATVALENVSPKLNSDRASGRKAAMSRPEAHSLWVDLKDASRNEIQRLIPTHATPHICTAIIPDLGYKQSARIAKDLVGAAAA
jgi:hypothetical protein